MQHRDPFILAKQSAGAASAVGSVRVINSSRAYALTCGGGFYAQSTTLGMLPPGSRERSFQAGMSEANTITKSGHILESDPMPQLAAHCNGGAGAAGKNKAGVGTVIDNRRYFATNSNAVIYEDTAAVATA